MKMTGMTQNPTPWWAVLCVIGTIAGGLTASGQNYEASATINQFTGPSSPPPGLATGSPLVVQLNLDGAYSYDQLNGADAIINFPAATFSFNSGTGGSTASGSIQGVTVFFADNYLGLGETVFEAQAGSGSDLFDIGFSKPSLLAADNSVGSLVNFLGSDLAVDINSSLQLEINDSFGQASVNADPLILFRNVASVPEPGHTGILTGLVLLGAGLFSALQRFKLSPALQPALIPVSRYRRS